MDNYSIYFLISETKSKTYVGFCQNLSERLKLHKLGRVKSTRNFGDFTHCILEMVNNISDARNREKYWKSAAGRRKLKEIYKKLTNG